MVVFKEEARKLGQEEEAEVLKITTSWKEEGIAEGLERGRGLLREAARNILAQRFGTVPDEVVEALAKSTDADTLQKLAVAAATVPTIAAFLEGL